MTASRRNKLLTGFGVYALLLTALSYELIYSVHAQEISPLQDRVVEEEADAVESLELDKFHAALAAIETSQGAYANSLPEQLYSLAIALQQNGQHLEAIDSFKRGTHITRINQGLFSAEQIPFLNGEIASHMAMGHLSEADERQTYLLKVQRRGLPRGEVRAQALMEQARWQQRAYELDIGGPKFSFEHLQAMWNLYGDAIDEILLFQEHTSASMLPPLNGLLQTQYLISTFEFGKADGADKVSIYENRADSNLSRNYKMGKSILQSIYAVELHNHGQPSLPTARTLIMMGDWMVWSGKRDSAYQAYLDAMQELSKLDDAEKHIERIFGTPVPLPDIDGLRSLPATVAQAEGGILLQFGVSKSGKVFDMVRLDEAVNESEAEGKATRRLMRRIRATKFRPRFDGVERVETEKVLWAYETK